MREHVVVGELELVADELERLRRDVVLDLESDCLAEPAPPQLHLDGRQQIVRLFVLDGQVCVPSDAERDAVVDLHAGEELLQVGADHLLQGHEPLAVGQHDEPGQQRRHLDPGEAALRGARVPDDHTEVEREGGDVREGVAGVDRQWGQHGEDATLELVGQPDPVLVVELGPAGEPDPDVGQLTADRAEEGLVGAGDEERGSSEDRLELLRSGHPVDAAPADTGRDTLLQPCDAHLEELVQVVAEDRKELHPLQQRGRRILGQSQHPSVEVEPRQLTVEVAALVGRHGAEPTNAPRTHSGPAPLAPDAAVLSGWRSRRRRGPRPTRSARARRRG